MDENHVDRAGRPGTAEGGYIVVETLGAFIPFFLLIVAILSLINIVTVQARVHYALTQAAGALSVYCYTLEVLGIANDLTTLAEKADKVTEPAAAIRSDIEKVLNGINSLSDLAETANAGKDLVGQVHGIGEDVVGDPIGALRLLMNYGINELRDKVFEQMARPLVGRYLAIGNLTGNEYLLDSKVKNSNNGAAGLAGLDFYRFLNLGIGNSALIDSAGNVKLVVEYEIEAMSGFLPKPLRPSLRITQSVITKAWLNGSGKGYW